MSAPRSYTITFSEPELQALVALIDAGLRHQGARAAKEAAVLLIKIEEASKVQPQLVPKDEQATMDVDAA